MIRRYKSSKIEKNIISLLERYFKVKLQRQFFLEGKFYDAKYKQHLIEIDGIFFHRTEKQLLNDSVKNEIALRNGFKLHRIRVPNGNARQIIAANIEIFKEIFTEEQHV